MKSYRGIKKDPVIAVENLQSYLGGQWVQKGLNAKIYSNEIVAVIGFSGCGKTTLLRSILMLQKPLSGHIRVFDTDVTDCTEKEAQTIQRRWGVMFQSGALFSSMDVLENILFPFHNISRLSLSLREEIAFLKLKWVGLNPASAIKHPSELSGGMQKRVALARAIVLDPELVFLDEPTSGLDIKSASEMDELILELRDRLGITFFMITHDLDSLWRVPDRVIFLGEGKVLAAMPMAELVKQEHPLIRDYFSGARAYPRNVGVIRNSHG